MTFGHAIRRTRWTKPCPMHCGNLCDREAKRCGSCCSKGIRQPIATWRRVCEGCGAVQIGKHGELPQPCAFCHPRRVLTTVAQPPVRPTPTPTIVRAGTCLEGDNCPRWQCQECGRYWLGSSAHRCQQGGR